MNRLLVKCISLTVLIAFFGLLSLGTIIVRSDDFSKHPNTTDCMGINCGPLDHVIRHNYIVSEIVTACDTVDFCRQDFVYNTIFITSPERVVESPPPQNSLV